MSSTPIFIEKYFIPYFKTAKKCKTPKECNFPCDKGWRRLDGECANNGGYYYYLFDSYPVATRVTTGTCASSQNVDCSNKIEYVEFFVDINGAKGSGILGKDVFLITLFNYKYKSKFAKGDGNHYGLKFGSDAGHHGAYSKSISEILNGNCRISDTSIHSGEDCGVAIVKNNWKVPKGYPIRF